MIEKAGFFAYFEKSYFHNTQFKFKVENFQFEKLWNDFTIFEINGTYFGFSNSIWKSKVSQIQPFLS